MKSLGILMLDTRFPRPVGDIGNPRTYAYPTQLKVVENASPSRVVHDEANGLLDAFDDAARELEANGCAAIITSCGFLALHQQRLANAVSIPVAASSLLLIPLLRALYGSASRIGVVTASARSLSSRHLAAVGAPVDTPIAGVRPDGEFARVITGNQAQGNLELIRREVIEAACHLREQEPALSAIVLECTNMPPYREEIRERCGVPVYDLVDLANMLMRGSGAITV